MQQPEEEKKETKIISLDNGKTHVAQGDLDLIKAAQTGEGLVPIPKDFFSEDFGKKIEEAHARHMKKWKESLSEEQMKFIRKCRVDDGCSWRAVAARCYDEFGELATNDKSWSAIPSNQLVGMELCEVAAAHFSEDYMQEPWN